MRLVRKDYSTEVVRRHKAELQAQQLDEQNLLNPNISRTNRTQALEDGARHPSDSPLMGLKAPDVR